MASKNSMLRKASWLGFKADFWLAICNIGRIIADSAYEKREMHEAEQARVLDEFERTYRSKDTKKED